MSHMLSGKAYSRALRGHLIVDQILSILLYEQMIENNSELQNMNNQIEVIYNDVISCKSELSDLSDDSLLASIALKMGEAKSYLAENHAQQACCFNTRTSLQ